MRFGLPALFLVLLGTSSLISAQAAPSADTDPLNLTPEVQDAFHHFYNLDYNGAIARFQHIQSEHPDDPLATAYLLDATLFQELNRLDLLDTTFYANDGFLTGKHTVVENLKVRDLIRQLADKAVDQANVQLKINPNNVDALFARGWARSLEATYMAMIERSFGAALKLALGARSDHDKVLQIDPKYADAKLVVGVYQYVIGALPFGFKLLIGFAGIHGSKTQGMILLHDAAEHAVITQVEAKTAMMLFLRREAKYQEAEAVAHSLAEQYPRDFLFCLEEANLEKDAGEGLKSIAAYRKVIDDAKNPGYFLSAHTELAYFGLGDSLRGQRMYMDAVDAYRNAAFTPSTSPELKRRCLLEAGKTYDLMQDHPKAIQEYQAVLDAGSDTVQGDQARKFIKTPYAGH
jgi:tetratricopeptide (TPR) repeat protein